MEVTKAHILGVITTILLTIQVMEVLASEGAFLTAGILVLESFLEVGNLLGAQLGRHLDNHLIGGSSFLMGFK